VSVPPGTLVGDKYRLEGPLGGCVYLARHVVTGERLALKLVQPADPGQASAAFGAFRAAARAAARFRSEHVAHVRDIGLIDDGGVFLVMEYLEGETLAEHLRERRELPVDLAVDLALQAVRGLGDAHSAGVIHRDAKPSNWFLARAPDGSVRVKMLDFGCAKIIAREGAAKDSPASGSSAVGTRPYAAPEQVLSSSDVDERADIWTVGVVLYEMLRNYAIGQRRDSFVSSPPSLRARQNGISPELEAVVLRCLAKRPEDRFPNMAELASALASLPAGGAASTAGERTLEPKAPPAKLPGARLVVAAGALSVALCAVLFFATRSAKPNASPAGPDRTTVTVSVAANAPQQVEAPPDSEPSSPPSASAPISAMPIAEAPLHVVTKDVGKKAARKSRSPTPGALPPAAQGPVLRAPPVGTAGFGDRE
jgi:serine/threonine-protein kinase